MKSELSNCKECGRLYLVRYGHELCPECSAEQQKHLSLVREYLREHPGQTASEIAAALNLNLRYILALVRKGSLLASLPDRASIYINC
jgi:hypothetical protein